MNKADLQYHALMGRIVNHGEWVENERTGTRCLTVINADFEYNVGANEFPLCTTRKSFWKAAVAEVLCYIRGSRSAADFRALGANTWNANANENKAWLANPYREGEDDMGRVYGVQGRGWRKTEGGEVDQFMKVYRNLKNGIDDRGEIVTYWNVGELHKGCLRPCMFMFQFSLLGDTLHLNAYQRSCDVPLGLNFNQCQVFFMLALMAKLTGHKAGMAYHKIVNAHIYEDQLEFVPTQLAREPHPAPTFHMPNWLTQLDDVTALHPNDFEVKGYQHHDPIKYPFTV